MNITLPRAVAQAAIDDPVSLPRHVELIDAVRKALAQPATQQPNEFSCPLCYDDPSNIKQPAPAGEPVAHREGHWCVDLTCSKCYSADFRLKHSTQPRKPIPLTDERIAAEAIKVWPDMPANWFTDKHRGGAVREKVLAFARAIEQAHGITGGQA